jgi:rhamnose utilization protein RhaD (predicted bifunctional aldolase and dehydrogenase)/NAD(P)-dependent dehydrogenase (short-subunit alcohol dehydrogenase family)
MVTTTQLPPSADVPALLEALVELSHSYGSDPELVLAGGGNTSVKFDDHLLVKGSGTALADIKAEEFVDLDRAALQALLERDLGSSRDEREAAFKEAVLAARLYPERAQRPSVEAVLHHLMPGRFVVHLHATWVNQFSCCREGRRLVLDNLGDDVIWVDLVDPGFALAQTLQQQLRAFSGRTGKDCPRAVIMQNHGLVVSGATPEETSAHIEWLSSELRVVHDQAAKEHSDEAHAGRDRAGAGALSGADALDEIDVRALVNVIGPALRALLSGAGEPLKVVTFDDSAPVRDLVAGDEGRAIAMGGPLSPDQIVYCRSFPLWVAARPGEPARDLTARLAAAVSEHTGTYQVPPTVVLVQGLGLFASGNTWADADTARLVYIDAIKVMDGARRMGGVRYLPDDFRSFIEHWEVESYRRAVKAAAAGAGRVAGKVAMVTGAAQGFGLEISQDLAAQGAHVVLSDVNAAGARTAAAALSAAHGAGKAIGLPIDVTAPESVAQAVHQVVRAYGGLDLLVSNAGVLRAASVKTQAEGDFDLSTAVNYKGYFLCVQKVAPVFEIQHEVRPDYRSDIIQINSKSGLEGSNKNFAYAGSKFGGIGLTESFALELVSDGVKVNSICPGNFFDGPLWSDPDMGLFAQYLRTGKVPGATAVADVRRFYESKVPMGRGCTTADVMKAIYYLVDQVYETGQALPVTGGQVMLH